MGGPRLPPLRGQATSAITRRFQHGPLVANTTRRRSRRRKRAQIQLATAETRVAGTTSRMMASDRSPLRPGTTLVPTMDGITGAITIGRLRPATITGAGTKAIRRCRIANLNRHRDRRPAPVRLHIGRLPPRHTTARGFKAVGAHSGVQESWNSPVLFALQQVLPSNLCARYATGIVQGQGRSFGRGTEV